MTKFHVLGFPRVGAQRELKWALESYWAGNSTQNDLLNTASALRAANWQRQLDAGVDYLTVGDFALYDHVLNTSYLLGHLPERARHAHNPVDQLFLAARGRTPCGCSASASEMTKWFDTNYHYLVPECSVQDEFRLQPDLLLQEVREAKALGKPLKAVVLGPLSYLYLANSKDGCERLNLLPRLLPLYSELFALLQAEGVDWLQIDEPILVLDLPAPWQQVFEPAYHSLRNNGLNLLLGTYFGALDDNLHLALSLPVQGLHVDLVSAPQQLQPILDRIGPYKVLSAGVIDGRNIWRADLKAAQELVQNAQQQLGERLWLASSCSLLHVPYDVELEAAPQKGVNRWLSFAQQKLQELALLRAALDDEQVLHSHAWQEQQARVQERRTSLLVHKAPVKQRAAQAAAQSWQRTSPFAQRAQAQQQRWQLPLFPTTTIGSFPQTDEVRQLRRRFRAGELDTAAYEQGLEQTLLESLRIQEQIGLDVLVHGEAERTDMVEYFGEQLDGIAVTRNGWVQSYGSRCVKPPVIFGDIERPQAMTVRWSRFAQQHSSKPVKGMLTGPVTILKWAFVRDDQPWSATAYQLAAVLRDEVLELQAAGIGMIQVDEPALREALPLRKAAHPAYLHWAVNSFRYAVSAVDDSTQIHTHMCYADFDDILPAIEGMDADVITLETARSANKLLTTLAQTPYHNGIGPGVYDIHSPNIPAQADMLGILRGTLDVVPAANLWVNPDCGLKTRRWAEVIPALEAMVQAAADLRIEAAQKGAGQANANALERA
ncbi:5-methyltetrahydropteroyltriglutamate--homocysteine S-methyltransferase [Venatoribacter cucullus]|uniref:5-methyltetrahydropteroyltriglutamate--homocysteine methyltransferase n=1 Tax=Venatoribacter cucullus TaxID=2661630 RepID=A0A9X7UYD2_9GAMM|nr:5-methyltetrahydropteroyltriglutamate--homocysteine S-methyltransferase [Venatoribacter cucullus]QQD24385.1 5-methyltetrahydropteroyltriglutamate--homocysteine S-methyltransferase [Venatoribacter cucullus]